MKPKEGLLTYLAEGNNNPNSRYYSRKIHWPGNYAQCNTLSSGVTIGRGYDLKYLTEGEVISDLVLCGIPFDKAKKIAKGVKKSHCLASEFIKENRDSIGEITEIQQIRLFERTYQIYVNDSKRYYNKFKKTESVSWEELKKILKDVLVDMKYQGRLEVNMIPIFGENDKLKIIALLRNRKTLLSDEQARRRIPYIEQEME